MTTFYVLIMIFSTGSPSQPFSIQAFDYPFAYEKGCQDRGELEAKREGTNLQLWGCEKVPLPIKKTET